MQRFIRNPGATSQIIPISIFDSSSTTLAKLAGLAFDSAGLIAYYNRIGTAGAATTIPLTVAVKGTWATGGFVAVDGTNMPGDYELHIPDAALAAGAAGVIVQLKGATNMVPVNIYIELAVSATGTGANNVTLILLNGAAAAQTITAATKANPCQLTIPAHGRSNGDKGVIAGVGGMVELNNRLVTVTVVDANNITVGIDSTGFTTFTTGGTITLTDEVAIQSAHLSIYDVTNTNLVTTAETNASGVSVQGSNAYVAMDSGNYVLRPTRGLMNATGDYAFTVSATGTKYFVATALTIAASGNPDLQRLTGNVKQLGIVWAVGDTLTLTPTGTQTVNGMIISNAPLVVTVNAGGELIDPVDGLTGVRVDKGAVLLAECKRGTSPVYTYYSKQITITSDAIKDLSTY